MKEMGVFRGKRKDNGEWIEGNLYHQTEFYGEPVDWWYIITNHDVLADAFLLEAHEVEPDSVEEYTRRTAKSGKRIFEGDIVLAKVTENGLRLNKYENEYVVKYHPEYCYFYLSREKNNILFDGNWSYFVTIEDVVGNVHNA